MEGDFEAKLQVNNVSIELNPFAEGFLARTVAGAVSTLRGAEDVGSLELCLEQGDIRTIVNGNELFLAPFPKNIITNTIIALVSSLKGVGKTAV